MAAWKNPGLTNDQHLTILGLGMASPGYWAQVVSLQQGRVRGWQEQLAKYLDSGSAGQPVPEALGSDARIAIPHLVGVEAHYLIYAADHVLTICRWYQGLSGNDPQFCTALAAFEKTSGGLAVVRDWLAHFEAYAIGTGKQSPGVQHDGPHIDFDATNAGSEVTFRVGTRTLRIHALADGVRSLAAAADAIWYARVLKV